MSVGRTSEPARRIRLVMEGAKIPGYGLQHKCDYDLQHTRSIDVTPETKSSLTPDHYIEGPARLRIAHIRSDRFVKPEVWYSTIIWVCRQVYCI